MGIIRDANTNASNGEHPAPAAPAPAPPVPASAQSRSPEVAPPFPAPEAEGRTDLRRRRDALAEQVTELHWDLGGLAYEMAIRDHFRLDVIVRRAGALQERDAELAEVERLLHMEESAVAGTCPHCAAPHSRGAVFCWQCGATLMERVPAAEVTEPQPAASAADASTAVMDALLAPDGHAAPPSSADE